ncbi:kinase-like domain-containing protein [Hyaloraphidium curvatum]|nr:kinase-like domain-containing protein [Hyaloraphidium curvatum]
MPNFLSGFLNRLTGGLPEAPPTRPSSAKEPPPATAYKRADYAFGATLGQGAFGLVKEATYLRTGEKYAVKTINKSLVLKKEKERQAYKAKQAKLKERIGTGKAGTKGSGPQQQQPVSPLSIVEREISILRRVKHPNVIELVDVFETRDNYYMVFPLCTGGELFGRIAGAGRFNERDAAIVMATVSNAVAFLHARGIVHRDIKPENLLFRDSSPDSSLVLVDFGISTSVDSADELLQSYCGSPGYAAPEIVQKLGYSYPADVWSLGVLAHLLLTGFSPFPPSQPILEAYDRIIRGHFVIASKTISDGAKSFVKSLMDPDPNRRPEAAEILDHPWIQRMVPKSYLDYLREINSEAMREAELEDALYASDHPSSNGKGDLVDSFTSRLEGATLTSRAGGGSEHAADAYPNSGAPSLKAFTVRTSSSALTAALADAESQPLTGRKSDPVSETPAATRPNRSQSPITPTSGSAGSRTASETSAPHSDNSNPSTISASSPMAIPTSQRPPPLPSSPAPVVPFLSPLGRSIPYPSSFRGMIQLGDEAEEEQKQRRKSRNEGQPPQLAGEDRAATDDSSDSAAAEPPLPNLLDQAHARDRYMNIARSAAGSVPNVASLIIGGASAKRNAIGSPSSRLGQFLYSGSPASPRARVRLLEPNTAILSSSPASEGESGPASDVDDLGDGRLSPAGAGGARTGFSRHGRRPSPVLADNPSPPNFVSRSPLSISDYGYDAMEEDAPFGINLDREEPGTGGNPQDEVRGEIRIAGRSRALSVGQSNAIGLESVTRDQGRRASEDLKDREDV